MSSIKDGKAVFVGQDEMEAALNVISGLKTLQSVQFDTTPEDFVRVNVRFAVSRAEMMALTLAIADAPKRVTVIG